MADMILPLPTDYIDIHTHHTDGVRYPGVVSVENLVLYEEDFHEPDSENLFTAGIHPWHIEEKSRNAWLEKLKELAGQPNILGLGEAGFDRLRGPAAGLQRSVFMDQARLASEVGKPLIIHCVKGWDEILSAHKELKPVIPWMIHGFRGSIELAGQLIARGFYISFWFNYILRPESRELVRHLPPGRIFLETDGSGVPISEIYMKAAVDMDIAVEELKKQVCSNFYEFFNLRK